MAMTYWHWWLLMGVLQCWVRPKSCLRRLSTVSMRLANHLELAHSYKVHVDIAVLETVHRTHLLDCAVYHHHAGYPSD
ncbi:uncharacterized protein C8R40DRAFT_373408 [Lentinula edodes]|uniref:uncharacterized protein n=1 Tax=Lentinula edodes TaxID=5353 RepID=UPI001E8DA064|nr:uncharacterized protein C8R40DRAFT_373408 [Lentinula edodes]KAH7873612.1 hypothetical protein C8R40DRAFT_373408 [Lentinula edodes]